MRFDILTIFPDLLQSPLQEGIIRRAQAGNLVQILAHNIRDYAQGKHSMTDDRPFGGGEGMVMKPEPIAAALDHVSGQKAGGHVVMLSPQGRQYNQKVAVELAQKKHIVLICGRYEGIDARIDRYIDDEISIGDYVLTGGELAALVLVDSIVRLLPGALGCSDSADADTFSRGLLKHSQYTRPREFAGDMVPETLMSGDHQAIYEWRLLEAVKRTMARRPELLQSVQFSTIERKVLAKHGYNIEDFCESTKELKKLKELDDAK